MGTQKDHRQGTGSVESLRDEFREHLHIFYSTLKLAAPYDTVEKALGALTARLKTLSPEELQQVSTDSSLRWTYFRQAFVESGLSA
ncbi:MAG TPA: hypothetical protein PLU01_02955, partial [Nitrospira sp.]|nr:hypothetical protein [Nitrospira sp.]